jgi:hypothetical protein
MKIILSIALFFLFLSENLAFSEVLNLEKINVNELETVLDKKKMYNLVIERKNFLYDQNKIYKYEPDSITINQKEYYLIDITKFNYHNAILIYPNINREIPIFFYDFAEEKNLKNFFLFDDYNSLKKFYIDKRSIFKHANLELRNYISKYFSQQERKNFLYFEGELITYLQQINSNILIPKFFDENLNRQIDYKFYKLYRENYSIFENFDNFDDFININKSIKRCNLTDRSIIFEKKIQGKCNLQYQKDGLLREEIYNPEYDFEYRYNIENIKKLKILTTNNILNKELSLTAKFFLLNGELIKKNYFLNETINVPNNTVKIEIKFADDIYNFPTFIHGIYIQLKNNPLLEAVNNFIISREGNSYNLIQKNQNILILDKKMSVNEIINLMKYLNNIKKLSDASINKEPIDIREYLNNFNFYAYSSQH